MSSKNRVNKQMGTFNGEGFVNGVLIIVLLLLLIFGSINIEDLTDVPEG